MDAITLRDKLEACLRFAGNPKVFIATNTGDGEQYFNFTGFTIDDNGDICLDVNSEDKPA